MAADTTKPRFGAKVQRYFNIDNPYRRVARFYPALMTVTMLLPLAVMLGIPLSWWLVVLSAGGGVVIATPIVAHLSHLASAAGNRVQGRLYPKWPYDSPTNRRLHSDDTTASKQQKMRWYDAILRLTGLDIAAVAGDPEEAARVINDAVAILRTKVFEGNKLAERLDRCNADYGLSRNFAGLRPAWMLTSLASCVGCWVVYAVRQENLAFPVIASAVFAGCVLAALVVKDYVRHTARHYSDCFFGTLDACDEACQAKVKRKTAAADAPADPPAA
jgi:hypothetical protein